MTAPCLAGSFPTSLRFFKELVLQSSHLEPAIKHAAIALGALNERCETTGYLPLTDKAAGYVYKFTIEQSNKAIKHSQRLLQQNDIRSIKHGLIVCVLFIMYEVMGNNDEAAVIHLQAGINVINRYLKSRSSKTTDFSKLQSTATPHSSEIDQDLIQLFSRLDVSASSYIPSRPPQLCQSSGPWQMSIAVDSPYQNFDEARDVLYELLGKFLVFARQFVDQTRYKTIVDLAFMDVVTMNELLDKFHRWKANVDKLCSRRREQGTSNQSDILNINFLLINYFSGIIMVSTCIYVEESVYDRFNPMFKQMVGPSRSHHRGKEHSTQNHHTYKR